MVKNAYPVKKRRVVQGTSQSLPIPGRKREMVQNRSGGFVFEADLAAQMRRFLILGTDSNTYYATSEELTEQNISVLQQFLLESPQEYLEICFDVYLNARSPKQDAVIFALALAISEGNVETRRAVAEFVKELRIATHLFAFVHYATFFRGWGRLLREAVAGWYKHRSAPALAYQVAKYGKRYGYTHADLFRLSHVKLNDDDEKYIAGWVLDKKEDIGPYGSSSTGVLYDYDILRTAESVEEALLVVDNGKVTHDMVPTQFKKEPGIWRALIERNQLPMTAMIRNLGAMTACGVFKDKYYTTAVCDYLLSKEAVKNSHLHPLSVLAAYVTYENGRGFRGSLKWKTNRTILEALDNTFLLAFNNVETIDNRLLVACDISGSMWSGFVSGLPGVSPSVAEAALCKLYADTEQDVDFVAFSGGSPFSCNLTQFSVREHEELSTIVDMLRNFPHGGTDCSLPVLWADEENRKYDTIIVITDNETWAGNIHPGEALRNYRYHQGLDTHFAVVAMTADRFSIADPADPGMLDFVGFDTAAPDLLAQFAKGMV